MWNRIVSAAKQEIPRFNDFLIKEYRQRHIDDLPEYNRIMLEESLKLLPGVKYLGYHELCPEEFIKLIWSKDYANILKGIDINRLNASMYQYDLEFEGEIFPTYRLIPFMRNNMIEMYGKKYFTIFSVCERGGIHRNDTTNMIVKVMRAPLSFSRDTPIQFISLSGKPYRETIITTQLYFGRAAKAQKPPLLLYLLSKFGFLQTMEMLGITNRIIITNVFDQAKEAEGWEYIVIPHGYYLAVHRDDMKDQHIRDDITTSRTLASLYAIFNFYPEYMNSDVVNNAEYYIAALGKYNNPTVEKVISLMENATNHIKMNDTLLDPISRYQLQTVGIYVDGFYDFILYMYQHIDELLNNYSPVNQFEKKIGALNQMMGGVTRNNFFKVYGIINNRNVGVNRRTIRRYVKSTSYPTNWLQDCDTVRCNPTLYNDNWIESIGLNRIRTLQNAETGERSKKKIRIAEYQLKAHASQLVVESSLDIPTSSPIEAGSINPYIPVNSMDGLINIPEYYSEIEDIYV